MSMRTGPRNAGSSKCSVRSFLVEELEIAKSSVRNDVQEVG